MKRKFKQLLACLMSSAVLAGTLPAMAVSAAGQNTTGSQPSPSEEEVFIRDSNGSLPLTEENCGNIELITSMQDYMLHSYRIEGAKPTAGTAYNLPSAVDNSTNQNAVFLPEVGDQGRISSCVAWSTVYYQLTYTLNKARGIPTTKQNTYSPTFVYNLTNESTDQGTFSNKVYDFLRKQGAVTIQDVPIQTDNSLLQNYLDWNCYDGIWEKALDNRILDYTYYYNGETSDSFFKGAGSYLDVDDEKITSPDSESIQILKKALSDGKILSFDGAFSFWNFDTIKDADKAQNPGGKKIDNRFSGESVAVSQTFSLFSLTGHEMTIVGYNDDIWTDINGNNVVDDGEMGAFKMVNSWGTGDWPISDKTIVKSNDGYLWIAYDSLNPVSAVSGMQDKKRACTLHAVSSISVDPAQNSSKCVVLQYSLNVYGRLACPVTVTAVNKKTGETFSQRCVPLDFQWYSPYGSQAISYSGSILEYGDGIMTVDLERMFPQIAAYGLEGFDWTVTVGNYSGSATMTVKDIRIIDKANGKEYPMNAVPGFTFTDETKTVSIPVSDEPAPQNQITIYYKGYSTPYIHYQIETGTWTDVPGKAMTPSNEVSGYTHKYTIDLGAKSYANVCFNNGGNSWDSRNGANYRFEAGTYTYSNGNASLYVPPQPKELSADMSLSAKNIPTSETVKISVSAEGGKAPYQYQYSYIKNGSETVIKNYSSDSSVNFTPSAAGTYTVKTDVKDASGTVVSKTAELSVTAVKVNSLKADKATVKTGESVVFMTDVSSGNVPVSCSYNITGNGTSQTLTGDAGNSVTWKPTKEGTYTVTVNVLYNGNAVAAKSVTYTVEKGEEAPSNEITIYYKGYSTPYIHYQLGTGAWTAVPGKAMTKTSEVSGFTHKYTIDLGTASYANVCFNDGGNNWDSRNGSNYFFEKGTYTFSNGTISAYEPPQPKELSASVSVSSKNVPVNQAVTVKAAAAGGKAPYQYQYSYMQNGSETVAKDYSSAYSADIKFTSQGTYTVKLRVKDAAGAVVEKTSDVTVSKVSINSLTPSSTALKTGEKVTFRPSVTAGNVPVIYQYTASCSGKTETLNINSDNSASWTPSQAGTYTVTVKLIFNGTAVASKSVNVTVEQGTQLDTLLTVYYKGYSNPYIHYQIGSGAWTAVPGKAMTKTSEMSGYTHKYTIDLGTASYANVCFNDGGNSWDSRNGANYRFEKGTYTYSNGSMVRISETATGGTQSTAFRALNNTSSVSKTNVILGSSFKVYAAAADGKGSYTYAVYYKKSTSSTWTTKQNYKSSSVIAIKPSAATTYDVCVKVKDSSGAVAKKYFNVKVSNALENNAAISSSSISLGGTVKLRAAASGGTGGYNYGFYYKKSSVSSWRTAQDYKSNSVVTIKPNTATTYDICIKVKDSSGTIAKKYFTVTVK